MNNDDRLRLPTNPPREVPPAGFAHIFFDAVARCFKAITSDGVEAPLGGGSSDTAPTVLTPGTALELPAPVAAARGTKAKYHITPSAGITLTMVSGILIPSDSAFVSKALASGKLYIVQLESTGSAWMLETVIGGY
jgi:hypothetical protein